MRTLKICLLSILLSWKTCGATSFDEKNAFERHEDSGHKIVDGAQIHHTDRFPFLAIFNFNPVPYAKCTASLISAQWVVSAAHCLGPKSKLSLEDCGSKLKGNYKCEKLKNKDMKIYPLGDEFSPEVLLGIANIHEDYSKTQSYQVEYIIRPEHSYPGGHYGTFGGYDIILIKLKKSVPKSFPPICLPSDKRYPDLGNATIAGYGRYRRLPCEVGEHGPHKFEFCGIDPSCTKGTKKYNQANCSVHFKHRGKRIKGCLLRPSPSSENEKCRHFHEKIDVKFSEVLDEIVIIMEDKVSPLGYRVHTRCFREDPGSYGWCGTIHDFKNFEEQDIRISQEDGWGFCQKSCYPNPDEELGGVERFKEDI